MTRHTEERAPEFPPVLDLIAPTLGKLGLLAAAVFAGGPYVLAASRLLVGAYFLGAISDAMLLGHWYLVQPGLRAPAAKDLVRWTAMVWPVEMVVFLWPTGMVQVLNGTVDDGYHGLLGWIWIACAITTIGLARPYVARVEGALLLGRDGRDRPAVLGDPDRLRHRPHRPRRPSPLMPPFSTYASCGFETCRVDSGGLPH